VNPPRRHVAADIDRPRILLSTYGDRDVGLVCRKCGCREFRVLYIRRIPDGIRRLKQCRYCGKRRMTIERG
jgi:hypothetical protein